MNESNNLLRAAYPAPDEPERFETLLTGSGRFRVERILSGGQITPEGEWYDQEQDEWVVLLEGEARLRYADGTEVTLCKGESLFLPKHKRHRVVYTSPACLWLAVHADTLNPEGSF